MSASAIRILAPGASKGATCTARLLCHVKPGVSASREGITSVSNCVVELCVAAQPKEGDANRAVRELIAKALKVPKSDVDIVRGIKGRDKAVDISNIPLQGTPEELVHRIRDALQRKTSRE